MIYAVSDTHGFLPNVPDDTEVLFLVGDICPDFRPQHARDFLVDRTGQKQALWVNNEFRIWATDLASRGVQIVAIWGNHDFVGEHPYLIDDSVRDVVLFLTDQAADLDTGYGKLRVYGTPWVPGLPYWAFYADNNHLGRRSRAIPEGLDVLLTHGPPSLAGDYVPTSPKQQNKYGNFGGMHVGDTHMRAAILRAKPKLTLCGHIHCDRGKHWVDEHPVWNVASTGNDYRPYDPMVTYIPKEMFA